MSGVEALVNWPDDLVERIALDRWDTHRRAFGLDEKGNHIIPRWGNRTEEQREASREAVRYVLGPYPDALARQAAENAALEAVAEAARDLCDTDTSQLSPYIRIKCDRIRAALAAAPASGARAEGPVRASNIADLLTFIREEHARLADTEKQGILTEWGDGRYSLAKRLMARINVLDCPPVHEESRALAAPGPERGGEHG